MQKVILSEIPAPIVPGEDESEKSVIGFIVATEPPIFFNPEVVRNAYTNLRLGMADKKRVPASTPFNEATLIGSTYDRTVIYVGLEEIAPQDYDLEKASKDLERITVELLALVGITNPEIEREDPTTSTLV